MYCVMANPYPGGGQVYVRMLTCLVTELLTPLALATSYSHRVTDILYRLPATHICVGSTIKILELTVCSNTVEGF